MYGFRKKARLGDVLVESGEITDEQLKMCLVKQKQENKKIGEVLIDEGLVTEERICSALSKQLHIATIDLRTVTVPESILNLIPESILRKDKVFPFAYAEGNMNMLRVAVVDPLDIYAMDDISMITNMQVEPVVVTNRELMLAIDKYYGNGEVTSALEEYAKEKKLGEDIKEELDEDVSSSPIVQLVKNMIDQGVRERASDIHIEPMENQVRIRFRIDGALYEKATYSEKIMAGISARIKIIGGMDISEKRKPQDGRITQIVDRQEYDIRVSILPTVYGEKIVMRLTSKTALTREKSQMGLHPAALEKFDRILTYPNGILLVTGPTGSGKSTTLYTVLSELNSEDVNIVTVEDPVEANIDGINQVHVNPTADLTFASALRSILRQDPDIIMIGEIRDRETAEIAVQASITGHLVVSTLHTNSAASTITRLENMGIREYLLADSIIGIIAQRLVRRLCTDCKVPYEATEEEKRELEVDVSQPLTLYKKCGCPKCGNTGYNGRIGVYEIMEITPEIKRVIAQKGTADQIKDIALKHGMTTLHMEAMQYVRDGITSIGEMRKVSMEE